MRKVFTKGTNWFRIFGIGLHWKDLTKERMSFSERNGHVNYTIRFGYLIRIIT